VAVVLTAVVALLLAVAIGVQVWYLRALTKAGVEINRSTKVISYLNIGLLASLLILLLTLAFMGRLPIMTAG